MHSDNIFLLRDELIKWKKDILTLLTNKEYHKEYIFLIHQTYLDDLEKIISEYDIMEYNNTTKLLQKIDSIDNESKNLLIKLNTKKIELNTLPKIFPLNISNYRLLKKIDMNKDNNKIQDIIRFISIFGEGMLQVPINELLYLIFFEDNGFLRQGFLEITNGNTSGKILLELQQNGPIYFVKNYTGKKIDDKECEYKGNDFNLFIKGKFNINIDKIKEDFEKINEEKAFKFRSKSMVISPTNLNLKAKELINQIDLKHSKFAEKFINIFTGTMTFKKLRRGTMFKSQKINNKKTNNNNSNNDEKDPLSCTAEYIKNAEIKFNTINSQIIIKEKKKKIIMI